jgi:hypothetical protein
LILADGIVVEINRFGRFYVVFLKKQADKENFED